MPRLAPVIMATLFMNIDGKVALITGSAKRVGKEIALELGRRGARLAIHYRASEEEAKAVAGKAGAVFQIWGDLGLLSQAGAIAPGTDSSLYLIGFTVMAGVKF